MDEHSFLEYFVQSNGRLFFNDYLESIESIGILLSRVAEKEALVFLVIESDDRNVSCALNIYSKSRCLSVNKI